MYPYFHKTTPLQAAESNSDDLIRTFLSQNPSFGTLLFQVTGGQGSFPIPNAKVNITKILDDRLSLSITVLTDESGKTLPLSLPAPSKVLSQSPNNGIVYASYEAEVTAEGYLPTEIRNLPVFDDVTTIQPVNLTTDFGQMPNTVDEIEDKEPDL
ncbi:MAG: carboxypeptidase regulatory-like domain-containing protein [Anaerotignum sp.]|nr:carboxypeptidase regulatory-like domain-containing protein [Anaerotignum sp.]